MYSRFTWRIRREKFLLSPQRYDCTRFSQEMYGMKKSFEKVLKILLSMFYSLFNFLFTEKLHKDEEKISHPNFSEIEGLESQFKLNYFHGI